MNFHETKIQVFCAIYSFLRNFLNINYLNEKSRNALASLNKTNLSSVLENQQAVAQGNNSHSKVVPDIRDPRTRSLL